MAMVREVLEGVVSPTIATSLLYEALEARGGPPPLFTRAIEGVGDQTALQKQVFA